MEGCTPRPHLAQALPSPAAQVCQCPTVCSGCKIAASPPGGGTAQDQHPQDDDGRAHDLQAARGFTQNDGPQKDGPARADHAHLRRLACPQVIDGGRGQKEREDGAEDGRHQGNALHFGRLAKHVAPADQQRLGHAEHAGHQAGPGRQSHGPQAADHLAGAHQVEGIAETAAQHQRATQRHIDLQTAVQTISSQAKAGYSNSQQKGTLRTTSKERRNEQTLI